MQKTSEDGRDPTAIVAPFLFTQAGPRGSAALAGSALIGRALACEHGFVVVAPAGGGPNRRARCTATALRALSAATLPVDVLLLQAGADQVVVDVLAGPDMAATAPVAPPAAQPEPADPDGAGSGPAAAAPGLDLVLHGSDVRLHAARTLTLEAGRSKIVLDASGAVTITGDQVTSRARRTNRVQGGNIQLN